MADIFDEISSGGGDIFDQISTPKTPQPKRKYYTGTDYLLGKIPGRNSAGQDAIEFLTGEHITFGKDPDPEVSFTPEGKMTKVVPESADPGIFNDPITWGVQAAMAPAMPLVKAGNRFVKKAVNKAAGMAREFVGQATGGFSDVAEMATKGAIKGAKGRLADITTQKGDIFDTITREAPTVPDLPQPPKINGQQLKLARNILPYYPNRKLTDADISILTEARAKGLLDPQETELFDRITGKVAEPEIKTGNVSSPPPIVEPGANMGVSPEMPMPKGSATTPPKKTGANNLIGRINELGGINPGSDYNSKLLRQDPDGKRILNMKSEMTADDVAAILNDEGWNVGIGDDLVEMIKAGKGRTVYAPGKADDIINRNLNKDVNAWAEEQAQEVLGDNYIPFVKGGMVGRTRPKYADESAINLDRLNTTEDVKQLINKLTTDNADAIGKHPVTWEQTRATAESLGWDVDALKKAWDGGKRFNASEIDASRQINLNAISNLHDQIKNLPYDKTKLTPEARAAFLDAMDTVRVTSQAASEAGRSLNIHKRILANDPSFTEKSALNKALKALQGKDTGRVDDVIDALRKVNFANPADVNHFVYNATKTKWQKLSDGAYFLWINGLLSNPLTHIVNTTSNALTLAYSYPEHLVAAGIESVSSKLAGRARGIRFRESTQDIFSMTKGLTDAVKRFSDVMVKGETFNKLDHPATSPFPDWFERIMPTRALSAEDAFFKAFIEHQELNRQAFRLAAGEGLTGEALKSRVTALLSTPTEDMLEGAARKAQYLTYQKELGEVGRLVLKLRDKVPGLKYFIPFVKTPLNIVKFSLERTPLNFANVLAKAAKGELGGEQLSEELAKPLLGSMLGYTVYQLAESGVITGGNPKEKARREGLQNTGWQPYSIKVGDKYYSFGRMEPIGSIMGLAADFSAIKHLMNEDEKYNVALGIYGAISSNIKDKTFMTGLSNIINATSDPGRYLSGVGRQLAGTSVPAVVAAIQRSNDPYVRDARGILDAVKSRVPGIAESLPAKLTIWGDPIERQGSAASRLFSPMPISQEKGSAVEREIVRLNLDIGYPLRKYKGNEIPQDKYWEMIRLSGSRAKQRINERINAGGWEEMPDERKGKYIKHVVALERERAKREVGFRTR